MADSFSTTTECTQTDSSVETSGSSSNGSTTDTQIAGSSSTNSSEGESRPLVSLMENLRAPTASELGRKRRIDANPVPPKGKKRSTQNMRKFDLKSVRPSQRASEFPGEELTESAGKLFCKACR